MAFEQKEWLNQDEDGRIPEGALSISATELNRIERGIADSVQKDGSIMTGFLTLCGLPTDDNHAATKKYVDTNILSYYGTAELIDEDKEKCSFTLPSNVNLNRYSVFIATNVTGVDEHGTALRHIPCDGGSYLIRERVGEDISVSLSKEGNLVFSLITSQGGSFTFKFYLFLVPTAQAVELQEVTE